MTHLLLAVLLASGLVETSTAASGGRVVIAAINTATPATIDVFVSNDAGVTWSAPMDMPMVIDGKTYHYAADPTLTVLDDGAFGLAYLVAANAPMPPFDLGDMGLVFVRSIDGVTWSAPQLIVSGHARGGAPLVDREARRSASSRRCRTARSC